MSQIHQNADRIEELEARVERLERSLISAAEADRFETEDRAREIAAELGMEATAREVTTHYVRRARHGETAASREAIAAAAVYCAGVVCNDKRARREIAVVSDVSAAAVGRACHEVVLCDPLSPVGVDRDDVRGSSGLLAVLREVFGRD